MNTTQSSPIFYVIAYDIANLSDGQNTTESDGHSDFNICNYNLQYNGHGNSCMSWADLVEEEELATGIESPLPPWSFEMPNQRKKADTSDADSVFESTNTNANKRKARARKQDQNSQKDKGRASSVPTSERQQRNQARLDAKRREEQDRQTQQRLLEAAGMAEIHQSAVQPTATDGDLNEVQRSEPEPEDRGAEVAQEPGTSGLNTRPEVNPEAEVSSPRFPLLFPARFVLHEGNQAGNGSQRSQSTSALGFVTQQGLEREAVARKRIALLEKNNPLSSTQNRDAKKQAPDNYTYEITLPDFNPVHDLYKKAARMLMEAREEYEDTRDGFYLKFNSRSLRSGDWIVWAEDDSTLSWLGSFFHDELFTAKFRATLVSDRGPLVRYAIKVQGLTAEKENKTIVDRLFRETGYPGYVRISDELRWYTDPAIQKANLLAKKQKKSFKPPLDAEYDKMFFLKVTQHAHKIMQENWDRLRIHQGVGKLKIELAKGSENVLGNKRVRPADDDDESRPSRHPRQEGETEADPPEEARDLRRSMSQLSIDLTDDDAGAVNQNVNENNGENDSADQPGQPGANNDEDAPLGPGPSESE